MRKKEQSLKNMGRSDAAAPQEDYKSKDILRIRYILVNNLIERKQPEGKNKGGVRRRNPEEKSYR